MTLEGVTFLLKWGEKNLNANGENEFVQLCETVGLLEKIEGLQMHENSQVYKKALEILESHF